MQTAGLQIWQIWPDFRLQVWAEPDVWTFRKFGFAFSVIDPSLGVSRLTKACLWYRKISILASTGNRTTAKVFPYPRKPLDIKIKKIRKLFKTGRNRFFPCSHSTNFGCSRWKSNLGDVSIRQGSSILRVFLRYLSPTGLFHCMWQ